MSHQLLQRSHHSGEWRRQIDESRERNVEGHSTSPTGFSSELPAIMILSGTARRVPAEMLDFLPGD